MEILFIIIILIVILLFVILSIMYFTQKKKLVYYHTISKNISAMKVIQGMFDILAYNISSDEKIKELNKEILKTYCPKYSSIVTFDGNNYEVRASNVEDEYVHVIKDIAFENEFKNNISRNVSKYVVSTADKPLSYRSALERRITSCMFSPIYFKNVFLGFWIIEDDAEGAFDNISKDELSKLKNNMGIFIENINYQTIYEACDHNDKQTGLYNVLYLYSTARQQLLNYDTSSLVIFNLLSIEKTNEEYGRNIGTILLIKVVNAIKEFMPEDVICIRYSGLKILVLVPGKDVEDISQLVEKILSKTVTIEEYVNDTPVKVDSQIVLHSFRKQNNIEKEIQKMVEYLNRGKDVNTIKII